MGDLFHCKKVMEKRRIGVFFLCVLEFYVYSGEKHFMSIEIGIFGELLLYGNT